MLLLSRCLLLLCCSCFYILSVVFVLNLLFRLAILSPFPAMNGCFVVVVLPRSSYYNYLTNCLVGSIITTMLVTAFITGIVYVGEEAIRSHTGMGITAIAMSTMFTCFIVVIVIWISFTDEVMKNAVTELATQMNNEIMEEVHASMQLAPAVNRWNYLLMSLGALPLSFHTLATPAAMAIFQLRTDSAYIDELRRFPEEARPYLIYNGATDGSFASAKYSESTKNEPGSLRVLALDASTDIDPFGGKHFRQEFATKKVTGVKGLDRNIELFQRDLRQGALGNRAYDPRQRPWFKSQLKTPDVPMWSDMYTFASTQQLGMTCTHGFHLPNNTLGGGSTSDGQVFAVDYSLGALSVMLNATMQRMKIQIPLLIGSAFIVENNGLLVGISSETKLTKQYPDYSTSTGLGAPQRINGDDTDDPIVKVSYRELVRRTDSSDGSNSLPAAEFAGFKGYVGDGSPVGRFLIRSQHLDNSLNLNWTVVVGVSEDSFFDVYRTNSVKAIVVGTGLCTLAVYCLSMLIAFAIRAHEERKGKIDAQSQYRAQSTMSQSFESNASTMSQPANRKVPAVSLLNQAVRAFGRDGTEDPTLRDENGHCLTDLSPDSQEFFDIWSTVLRPAVEAANLAQRLNNVNHGTEPRPPSIFGILSGLVNDHSKSLRELFDEFDVDGTLICG